MWHLFEDSRETAVFTWVRSGQCRATRDGSKPARLHQVAAEPSARPVFRPTLRRVTHPYRSSRIIDGHLGKSLSECSCSFRSIQVLELSLGFLPERSRFFL